MHCLDLRSSLPVLFILWFVFAMLFVLLSIHCGLLGGEFKALISFKIKLPFLNCSFCGLSLLCTFSLLQFTVDYQEVSSMHSLFSSQTSLSCSFYGLSLPCSFCLFQCTVDYQRVSSTHCFHLKSNLPVLFILWFVFAMLFMLLSMHCGLLGGEFKALFSFKIKLSYLVHFVVCLCCSLSACFYSLWIARR